MCLAVYRFSLVAPDFYGWTNSIVLSLQEKTFLIPLICIIYVILMGGIFGTILSTEQKCAGGDEGIESGYITGAHELVTFVGVLSLVVTPICYGTVLQILNALQVTRSGTETVLILQCAW
eukprot:UN28230